MKDLNVIFVSDIGKILSYPVYRLVRLTPELYGLEGTKTKEISDNLCHVITEENKILSTIYKDNVVSYKQIIKGIYKEKELDNSKKLKKIKE